MVLLNQQYNEKQKQFLHRKPRTLGRMERIISPWYLWRIVRNLPGIFDGCKTLVVMNFEQWYNKTIELVVLKQNKPIASYRKNKWVKPNGVWKKLYNEGRSPEQAVALWGLNHNK